MLRRFMGLLLALSLLVSLAACGAQPAEVPEETTASTEATTPPTTEETLPPVTVPPEGFLYLTVSRIDFSIVGESETIYTGTVPVESVTFGTGDETIATFENGVLTATGVGETTAWAECGQQRIECAVSCLAQTQEELLKLDWAILRSPKRLPPALQNPDPSYFDDTAIVGDSITWTMGKWHTLDPRLGKILFMTQGGSSINGFLIHLNNLYFQGRKMAIEDALAASGVKKVFIMLGQNDLGYLEIDATMKNWGTLIDRIQGAAPDLEIYLESCIPEWRDNHIPNTQNEKIDQHNILLKEFCEERGLHYVEVGAYAEDHVNKMPKPYHLDNDQIHFNEVGNKMWMDLLLAYAEYETMLGETK